MANNVWDVRGTTAPASDPNGALNARLFVKAGDMESAMTKVRDWSNKRHGGAGCFTFLLVKEVTYRGKSILDLILK